ncbi:MAG TPA: glycosyltransferase 61 family protein [Verrucomicrobiae bacterium]
MKRYLWNPIVNSARPDFCERILDRALLEKWPVKKTHEPFILDLPIPRGCEADPAAHAAFTMHQRTGFPAQYLVGIPNGVAAGAGLVRLSSGEFLTESTWRTAYLFDKKLGGEIYRARFRRHKLHLKGDYYYADMLFSTNYAHWFLDELPRLVAALPHLPPETRFIVSDPCQEFKLKSLTAFGIGEERILPVKGFYETHCERLWFATPLGSCEWASTSPQIFDRVRTRLVQTYGDTDGPTPERIFISRSGAPFKRLANEAELLPLIERHGFSVVKAENLSFAQQVRTFSKARVVLGAHGAGMTNLLFSPRGAQLLELQDARFAPRRWYWKMPAILGHEYSTMTGREARSSYEGDVDFTIHPDSLAQYLESSLSSDKLKIQWWVSK